MKDFRISHPVAVDNEHTIWRAFKNQYWPALYDAQGRLRHHHFGEGSYEQSEKIIQDLLAEAGATGIDRKPVSVDARGIEAAADWSSLLQACSFGSSGALLPHERHRFRRRRARRTVAVDDVIVLRVAERDAADDAIRARSFLRANLRATRADHP